MLRCGASALPGFRGDPAGYLGTFPVLTGATITYRGHKEGH